MRFAIIVYIVYIDKEGVFSCIYIYIYMMSAKFSHSQADNVMSSNGISLINADLLIFSAKSGQVCHLFLDPTETKLGQPEHHSA